MRAERAVTGRLASIRRGTGLFVVLGGVLGGLAGAVTGLVIGIRVYLPTAPFAAVEGAAFGMVGGVVLAGVIVAVAQFARMIARR
jgi:hypothetical protein